MTRPLTDLFISSTLRIGSKGRLSRAYQDLIQQVVKASHVSAITPRDIKFQISRLAPQFSGYGQQDAQEFLRFFIDGMHEELNRVTSKPKYREINVDKLPPNEQSEAWWSYFEEREQSPISDLFQGQLMSKIECQSCKYSSYAFDNFMDLSVSFSRGASRIIGKARVEHCLESYIKPERMEECGFKCEKCKKVDNFEKQMTVYRLPQILVLHLKRFYNSHIRREKLNTHVAVPDILDMKPYAPYSSHDSVKKAKYKLYGISHHSGTLYGGHYFADVRNEEGSWYHCNDSHASKTRPDLDSASSYVLFYERC